MTEDFGPKLYVLDGKEPRRVDSLMEWSRLFEIDNRQVAETWIGPVRISTVFLGVDHSHFDGPPLIFETLVFGGALADEMDRYSTFDEAEAGHAAMVARVKAAAGLA